MTFFDEGEEGFSKERVLIFGLEIRVQGPPPFLPRIHVNL